MEPIETGPADAAEHPPDATRQHAERVLRELVGSPEARLREDQWVAVTALLEGRRALVVQRTGWGKSAVYFVTTALLRARGRGPTVIVSPLLALMRNQVDAALRAGIRAETINSANTEAWDEVQRRVLDREVDVLLVSPERLTNPTFRDEVLPRLAQDTGLLVVDEAHCISDWGHDFRPDYRRLRTLLAGLPTGTPVLATTATANTRVTTDVAAQLAEHSEGGHARTHRDPRAAQGTARQTQEVLVLRGPLERSSLRLSVHELGDPAAQLAWLTQTLPRLEGSGIIYCLTVAAAEQVAAHLGAAGLEVRAYTGQTDPTERLELERELLANEVKALVATSALGMGFDKPDLRFVVHLGAPSSPIAYYQQVGRAGRATDRAEVVLLPGRDDRAVWDWYATMAFPGEEAVRTVLDVLGRSDAPMSTAAVEPHVPLRRGRLELMLRVLDVDGAVRRVRGGWEATGTPWTYDAERYAAVEEARRREQDLMVEYIRTPGCRMAHLRTALDDPELLERPGWTCGRCDRCMPAAHQDGPDPGTLAAARARLATPGAVLTPRRQWPSGMASLGIGLSGRIPEGERPEPGRALARLDGLGLGGTLRALLDPHAPDQPVPEALRRPLVELLEDWAPQVDGIVVIRSATRPRLLEHLTSGLSRHLDIPVVGAFDPGNQPAGRHDVNSARRAAAVMSRTRLQATDRLDGRSVLLVDDRSVSGWTLTVAARELRRAGSGPVSPLVLGLG